MNSEVYTTKLNVVSPKIKAESLNLSMVYGQQSFMFASFSQDYSKCYELTHVKINSEEGKQTNSVEHFEFLVNNFQLKSRNFQKVEVAFLSSQFTLMPHAYAEQLDSREVLTFSNGSFGQNSFRNHKIDNLDFNYSIGIDLLTSIERTFKNCRLRHSGAVCVSLGFTNHVLAQADLCLNVFDTLLEISIKSGKQLLFYNNFKFESNEDILYYLLFTMEQFGLNPLQVKVAIAGEIEASGELSKILKRYIKHIRFCASHPNLNLEKELHFIPNHNYFTLLNQHLCEL